MSHIVESNAFAVFPHYYVPNTAFHGDSICSIIKMAGFHGIDIAGTHQYLKKEPDGIRTCAKNIIKLPPNNRLRLKNGKLEKNRQADNPQCEKNLHGLLAHPLKNATSSYARCALALSGGLDSALVLALIKEASIPNIEVYTLATGMHDYCEIEKTKRTAKYFGVKLNIVWATASDFVDALPNAIRSSETPLFNLHPISKLLLARKMFSDGIDCIITGDAADQVFSGTDARNYLPIVGAIIKNEGLAYVSPFFDDKVVNYGRAHMDENKSALREICTSIVPDFLQIEKKSARYAPQLDINRYWNPANIKRISKKIGVPINAKNYASKTLWTTLGMLLANISGAN